MKYNKILLGLLIPCVAVTLLSADESWTTGAYANNVNISKTLTIPDTEELIVNISGETEKDYDFIIIKDSNGNMIKRLSGKINESFIVSGSLITANLKSDYSITKSGVTVSIKAKTEVAKSKSWTTGAYQNNEHIEKKLTIPNAKELEVTIVGETEENYDFITIKNSENKNIKKLSGRMNNHFKVKGNSITAILDSDYSITKSGVTVTIKNVGIIDDNDGDDTEKPLTREELKQLLIDYGQNPTAENKRAIEEADTSLITDMSHIFDVMGGCDQGEALFDGDISDWDTSNVTNMKGMFENSAISNLPDSFNTLKVTNMWNMFSHSKIEQLPDNFNTSKVTNMRYMFNHSKIKKLPDNFDTSHVTDMAGMFSYSSITTLPSNFDTSHVTDMLSMFKGSKITNLPENFNTSKVTTMKSMFERSLITQLPENFDTSKVTNMESMFEHSPITQLSENFDTSNVRNMEAMFRDSQITKLPENFNTTKVTNMDYMFTGSKITTLPSNLDTSNVSSMVAMFVNSKITKLPDNFNTAKVRNMSGMFRRSKITKLPDDFDTSSVVYMNDMFENSKIKELPDSFDTSKVLNMSSMFYGSQIEKLPYNFDTSNVTELQSMFKNCKTFNQDIRHWDVSNVSDYVFLGDTGWKDFNKNSSLEDKNIPEKFRED